MESDEISEDEASLQPYLQTWNELGFDISSLGDDLKSPGSSKVEELQTIIDSAISLFFFPCSGHSSKTINISEPSRC